MTTASPANPGCDMLRAWASMNDRRDDAAPRRSAFRVQRKPLVIAALMGLVMLLSSASAFAATTSLPVGEIRIAGANRFDTSVEISKRSFVAPLDAVYIATGRDYADALAGGPAAAQDGAPILIVEPTSIPDSVSGELQRLQPGTIYILGGTSAVSTAVESDLGFYTDSVVRLSGQNRYETAVAVSNHITSTSGTVFLASGSSFADGLSGGAAAARIGARLLLTKPNELPSSTSAELTRLVPDHIYELGGPAAISLDAGSQIREILPDARRTRLTGNNRYETSAAIAEAIWPDGASTMFYATGLDFADALSGTPSAHINDAPILLTRTTCLPKYADELKTTWVPTTTAILGGVEAITDSAIGTNCGQEVITNTRGYTCTEDGDCRWADGTAVPGYQRCGTLCGEPPTSGEIQFAGQCREGTVPAEDCEDIDVDGILAWADRAHANSPG